MATTTNPTPTFDPVRYKETTRQQWQNAAEAWHCWDPVLQAWLGSATQTLLDLARIGPGHYVLDVAAGAGEPALSTAERVGPSGYVLATDISSNILEYARQAAAERGLSSIIETRVMDGENLELPDGGFDAVISRVGLIYFPDQQRALSEMRRVLKTGGAWGPSSTRPRRTIDSFRSRSRSFGAARSFRRRCRASPAHSASGAPVLSRRHTGELASAT